MPVPIDLLAQSPLFQELDPRELAEVHDLFEPEFALSGETLIREGDPSDALYLVLSGRLQVVARTADGKEELLAEVAPGDTLGEMGLITGEPRSATVVAARDSEFARLSRDQFAELTARHPGVLLHISRILIERLRGMRKERESPIPRTLAVLRAGHGESLDPFVTPFMEALSQVGSALRIDAGLLDTAVGSGSSAHDVAQWDDWNTRIAAWLSQQESEHQFLVFECDAENSPWTRRCLRQADRVLLVGWAHGDSAVAEGESHLLEERGTCYRGAVELVLLHERADEQPRGTAAWLRNRPVIRHHHVHPGTQGHLERVVRFLTNRAVGVVLGGGGAKGAAHIGVMRALAEAGIPVDMLGGTSSGGGIAAQFAMGLTVDEVRQQTHERFVVDSPFKKYTVPISSLLSPRASDRTAQLMFRDVQIEDLWLPYFCVSCNLSTGETVVHRRGSLWRAVRATTAIPGVVAPVVDGSHLLVDGGVVDNVPVAEMKRGNLGPAIVVNVSPDVDLEVQESWDSFPSGWAIARAWANPFGDSLAVPSMAAVLGRVAVVNTVARKRSTIGMADFFLEPPLSSYGLLDFDAMEHMTEIGYDHARQTLEMWMEDPVARGKLRP